MKYIIEPSLLALDENVDEKEFKLYVNRLLQWEKWLEMFPEDIYILSSTSDLLYNMRYFPIYPVLDSLKKKYKMDYVEASHLNQAVNRLLYKTKKIDIIGKRKIDDDVILVNLKTDATLVPIKFKDTFERLLWCLYCMCQKNKDTFDSFVVFGKNLTDNIALDIEYQTITEENGELKESVCKDKINMLCKSSLADFFKDKNTPLSILKKSDSISNICLAVRVSVYQNGNLKKVMDAYDNYNFKIQDSFHKDYTNNHYLSQPSFLVSFADSMSHSLLNMNLRDLEDFRTGRGGNNPQKKHSAKDGTWEAWRWKVTESVSYQYWRLNEKYKFANIGEHDYYVCKWED